MTTTVDLPDGDYVLGPANANRNRSVYRVTGQREGELLLRFVGVLAQLGIVHSRRQVLPGDTWMSAGNFTRFDVSTVEVREHTADHDRATVQAAARIPAGRAELLPRSLVEQWVGPLTDGQWERVAHAVANSSVRDALCDVVDGVRPVQSSLGDEPPET